MTASSVNRELRNGAAQQAVVLLASEIKQSNYFCYLSFKYPLYSVERVDLVDFMQWSTACYCHSPFCRFTLGNRSNPQQVETPIFGFFLECNSSYFSRNHTSPSFSAVSDAVSVLFSH